MMIILGTTFTSVCIFTSITLLAIRLADLREQARQDNVRLVAAIADYKATSGPKS